MDSPNDGGRPVNIVESAFTTTTPRIRFDPLYQDYEDENLNDDGDPLLSASWTFHVRINAEDTVGTVGGDNENDDDDDDDNDDDDNVGSGKKEEVKVPASKISYFQKHGFVVFRNVLSQSLVNALNEEFSKVLQGQYNRGTAPDKVPKFTTFTLPPAPTLTSHSNGNSNDNDNQQQAAKKTTKSNNTNPHKTKEKNNKSNVPSTKVVQVINVHKANHLFRQVATSPILGQVVAQLAGWTRTDSGGGTRLAQDQMWAKPPQSPPLSFHRDAPYFMFRRRPIKTNEPSNHNNKELSHPPALHSPQHTLHGSDNIPRKQDCPQPEQQQQHGRQEQHQRSNETEQEQDVITVWIALDTMKDELGPLHYVSGSHLWNDDGRCGTSNQFFDSKNGGWDLVESAAQAQVLAQQQQQHHQAQKLLPEPHDPTGGHNSRPESESKSLSSSPQRQKQILLPVIRLTGLPAGSIAIHHGRLWHGSGPNKSSSSSSSTCCNNSGKEGLWRRGWGLHFVPAQVCGFLPQAAYSRLWKPYYLKQQQEQQQRQGQEERQQQQAEFEQQQQQQPRDDSPEALQQQKEQEFLDPRDFPITWQCGGDDGGGTSDGR
ncbi:hypothetical protein ACA910_022174 [Epithemia clementina (nom. ined.)]